MITDIYKTCMEIGHIFWNKYNIEETHEWNGTEECATLAKSVCQIISYVDITVEKALDQVMEYVKLRNYTFKTVDDHGWDDYTRGFLAGEILGMPTEENMAKAEIAEQLWDSDDGDEYGYYQEVLDEVKDDSYEDDHLIIREFDIEMNFDDYIICKAYGFDFKKNFEQMVKDIARQLRECKEE